MNSVYKIEFTIEEVSLMVTTLEAEKQQYKRLINTYPEDKDYYEEKITNVENLIKNILESTYTNR